MWSFFFFFSCIVCLQSAIRVRVCAPPSHLAACGFCCFISWTVNEGKNPDSWPQDNSPGSALFFFSFTRSVHFFSANMQINSNTLSSLSLFFTALIRIWLPSSLKPLSAQLLKFVGDLALKINMLLIKMSQDNLWSPIKTRDSLAALQTASWVPHMVKSFSPQPLWEAAASTPPQNIISTPLSVIFWLFEGSRTEAKKKKEEKSTLKAEKQLLSQATRWDLCLPSLSANHKLHTTTRNTGVHKPAENWDLKKIESK